VSQDRRSGKVQPDEKRGGVPAPPAPSEKLPMVSPEPAPGAEAPVETQSEQ
jgi:hypothetical protein